MFESYKEFNFYRNQYSVQYPFYLVAKAIETGLIYSRSIFIGYEKDSKIIWCTDRRGYNGDVGMNIDIQNDNFL